MNGFHHQRREISGQDHHHCGLGVSVATVTECNKFSSYSVTASMVPGPALDVRGKSPPDGLLKKQHLQQHHLSSAAAGGGCALPPLVPHTEITSPVADALQVSMPAGQVGGALARPPVTSWSSGGGKTGPSSSDNCLYKTAGHQIKEEPPASCAHPFPISCLPPPPATVVPTVRSVASTTTVNCDDSTRHFQAACNGTSSPPAAACAAPCTSAELQQQLSTLKQSSTGDVKLEQHQPISQTLTLFPPIIPPVSHTTINHSGSGGGDFEETDPAPLNPPLVSFSPYFGSGISDSSSLPSISNSTHQISRKRTHSPSPLLDLTPEPPLSAGNSVGTLMGQLPGHNLLNNNNNTATNSLNASNNSCLHSANNDNSCIGNGSVREVISQRKLSLEHIHHTLDGSKPQTSIANQITFCDPAIHAAGGAGLQDNHNPSSHQLTGTGVVAEDDFMEFGPHPQSASPQNHHPHHLPLDHTQHGGVHHHHHLPTTAGPPIKEEMLEPRVCLWNGCGQEFMDLDEIVQHIENTHIEKGKMDDFTCMWQMCPRKCKPFNARYKLLIHMRIHSGEKPNKCTVSFYFTQLATGATKMAFFYGCLCSYTLVVIGLFLVPCLFTRNYKFVNSQYSLCVC